MSSETNKNSQAVLQHVFFIALSIIVVAVLVFGWLYYLKPKQTLESCSYRADFANNAPTNKFVWHGGAVVSFWFDDGWKSQFTNAFPIMQQAGLTGTMSVISGSTCTSNFVTWNELRYMQAQGWEMTAHTIHHYCDLHQYDDKTIADEFGLAKKEIAAQGLEANIFVMPCGSDTNFLENAAKKYAYSAYRAGIGHLLNPLVVTDPYNISGVILTNSTTIDDVTKLVAQAQKNKAWLILVFHGVDYSGGNYTVTPEKLSAIVALVKKAQVQIALPQEVLKIQPAT